MDKDEEKQIKKKPVSAREALLWDAATRDVTRLEGKTIAFSQEMLEKKDQKPSKTVTESPDLAKLRNAPVKKTNHQGKDLDKRTEERFRRGHMPIEARIDLHGMNQEQARMSLERFILSSYEAGKRCVLVITGKGATAAVRADAPYDAYAVQPGILRARTPVWLTENTLGPYVLKFCAAQPKDGGAGALYVLLRRKRKDSSGR